MTDTHLVVDDETNGRWEGDGGNASQKITELLAHFESAVTSHGPQQTVDEVLAHVALQVISLWTFLHSEIISIFADMWIQQCLSIFLH